MGLAVSCSSRLRMSVLRSMFHIRYIGTGERYRMQLCNRFLLIDTMTADAVVCGGIGIVDWGRMAGIS